MTDQSNINNILHLTQELRDVNDASQAGSNIDPLDRIKMSNINNAIDDNLKNLRSPKVPTISTNIGKSSESDQYKIAFKNYLSKGVVGDSLLTNNNHDVLFEKGRFAASRSLADNVHAYLNAYSVMRRAANVMTTSLDTFDAVGYNDDIDTSWSDGSSIGAATNSFVKKQIKLHELNAQPKITQRTIDDAQIDIESYISERLSLSFLDKEDAAFIAGSNGNQPKGILSYPATGANSITRVKSGQAGGMTVDSIMQLYYALPERYAGQASFIMNRATVQTIRTFKDGNNQYIWTPGLLSQSPDTLLGAPLYVSSHVPVIGANKDVVIYGNFKYGYQIVDRGDISIQRDPFTAKPFVIFFATKRVGGDVIDNRSMVILNISA